MHKSDFPTDTPHFDKIIKKSRSRFNGFLISTKESIATIAKNSKFKKYNEGSVPYLHKDRIPLKVANLNKPKDDVAWTLFDDECEGMCGV